MVSTPLHNSIQPLGRYYNEHCVLAISQLYWHTHPYRLILLAKGYGNKTAKRQVGCAKLLVEELKSLLPEASDEKAMRIAIHKQRVFLYITDYALFEHLASAWTDRVIEVAGPISHHHVELLTDPHCECEVREHLWWQKFDMRIDANAKIKPMLTVPADATARLIEARQYLIENLEHIKTYKDSVRYGFTAYVNHAEFMKFWGFFTLAYPEINLVLIRCFVNDDKYLS